MEYDFKEELMFLDRLNNDGNLFEREFEIIKNKYPIKDCNKVHDFISENRGLIIILNKMGALLSQHAPYVSRVYMELDGIRYSLLNYYSLSELLNLILVMDLRRMLIKLIQD